LLDVKKDSSEVDRDCKSRAKFDFAPARGFLQDENRCEKYGNGAAMKTESALEVLHFDKKGGRRLSVPYSVLFPQFK